MLNKGALAEIGKVCRGLTLRDLLHSMDVLRHGSEVAIRPLLGLIPYAFVLVCKLA